MGELMTVKDYAQQIAEAIATVVKIDVEIADHNLMRIAGTGRYHKGVGQSMDRQGYVYQEVLRTGHQFVIETPGIHPLCAPCKARGNCSEKYEVVSPINVDDKAVGAIGLICFTEAQAKLIQENQHSYLIFLTKMAETIALKMKEQEFLAGLVSANHYLNSIIDCLEEGLITVDLEGNVLHYNQAAKRMFSGNLLTPKSQLKSLFSAQIVSDILGVGNNIDEVIEREVHIETKKNRVQMVLRALPIDSAEGVKSIGITLRPIDEIGRIVHRLSLQDAGYTIDDFLGVSDTIHQVRERAKEVAVSKSTVLIRGESGTGKEMLARSIHNLSSRQQGMFVAINCTAIPETLLESELFGYEEGAFTGARKGGKIGKFELANKGTLFLDEIGDMPLFLQAKILRVLQERQIERVGGMAPIPVDVRVIAATHRNLEEMMAKGEFREDLYYRINVIPIDIKPLRERKEDLQVLCEHFIKDYNRQLNKDVQFMTEGFRKKLYDYTWPGNVRELQNIVEFAMNLAKDSTLTEDYLSPRLKTIEIQTNLNEFNLEKVERETILRCYQTFGTGVQGKEKAAKALGIGIATLYRKLARYNIE
ncbi:transcriptional regulator containing PAS, AAA-type ATPase, and DNA-binding domains [Desulfosporosinus orientis DSM 765]|uniref:Transcriptional regulator containing PAS, AAA-type ATPase, and DNA-binding domains n=1 Tax=Desulfosporosinus orientis (strain ATCC 19365 / DSM 765 / NCIMB 8382 / VKM B-1628 / Singapore I) TaxID=768706 RepID=G7W5T0_DESOD|nr:sigma 54-interacting transcriptional regulator [Desulfosporosinus orientis]AET67018.1 transcriptional regulator containing PAS, AAA-type ATPase, and DNA-binding domains [Desulfosporosinus orientis DSM 765]